MDQISLILLEAPGAAGGLTSALLLITNSSPSAGSLGEINWMAQTVMGAGRAVGPVVAGGLFSATSGKGRLGKLNPFGFFEGVAMLGFVASWGIRGGKAGWVDEVGGERSEEDRGRDQM